MTQKYTVNPAERFQVRILVWLQMCCSLEKELNVINDVNEELTLQHRGSQPQILVRHVTDVCLDGFESQLVVKVKSIEKSLCQYFIYSQVM